RGDDLFNPAAGALVEAWGFHADEFVPRRPEPAQREALVAAKPRMADLVITPRPDDGATVSSRNPAVQLDLGGYGKGYALDRAAAILRARGVCCALV
ncbi:FAD:protein FMN transferase, partial [Enterobacter hormaechei]|nr:FAD:protein FMN transferase [Enterobacter hormaechei]